MKILVLDTETTGLPHQGGKILEVAAVLYDNGVEVDSYEGLQDPGERISPVITRINGITDEMARGQNIDWSRVSRMYEAADLNLAFNTPFDRYFLDPHTPSARQWACAMTFIDWREHGMRYTSLEYLVLRHLKRDQRHRAMGDVRDTWDLLQCRDPQTPDAPTYLCELIEATKVAWGLMVLSHTPRGTNDAVKSLGFRWNPAAGVWWRPCRRDRYASLANRLAESVWRGDVAAAKRCISGVAGEVLSYDVERLLLDAVA